MTRKGPSMSTENTVTFDTMSEADLGPVLEILQGKDPDTIAQKTGITKKHLLQTRDNLLAQFENERAKAVDGSQKKIGRNAPCPCGSGEKYKYCCLDRHQASGNVDHTGKADTHPTGEKEQAKLIQRIEKAFGLLRSGRYTEAMIRVSKLIPRYPNEDRLHDILVTGHLYAAEFNAAIKICRHRLAVAESEKAYFIEHGKYRDSGIDSPALAYYYPPLTWLQKLWIAVKSKEYRTRYPFQKNAAIIEQVHFLETADDVARFPETQAQGLERRRYALKETLESLKTMGPEVIPYLLPVAATYGWAGIFVPEILSAYPTVPATRALIEISMFGFAYASGASLHFLEKRKDTVIPAIQEAFSSDREFDPIKTGIVSVLGNIRTPAAYELLLVLLAHESPHIVNWAGDALGKFGNVTALPAMVASSKRIGGERMIDAAIDHLKDLENTGSI